MSAWDRRLRIAVCLLAMSTLALAALKWLGMTWISAVVLAIAAGCLVAAVYAWWLGRRVMSEIDAAAQQGGGTERRR